MKGKYLFLLIILTSLFVFSANSAPAGSKHPLLSNSTARAWNPARTWVYFVGLLEWQNTKNFASFPQKNRRDEILVNVLRQSGVPENQIVYLKDSEATIAKVKESFPKFLQQAKDGDTVIVYFCGHGYRSADNKTTYFATYDAGDKIKGWDVNDLTAAVENNFKGATAILMADNCYSGALAESVKAIKNSRIAYAALTSAHYNSFSTGNWTFTESMIYAFRGDAFADDDHDGEITFAELETNAAADMLFAEEQIAEFAYTPGFDKNGVVAPAKAGSAARLGERVEAYSVDGYYKGFIRDAQNGKYKVRYYGYEESDDELVAADKIRPSVPKQYEIGSKVNVEWLGKWFPAKVINVKGGSHLVTYEGYTSADDEWVPSRRIKSLTEAEALPKDLRFAVGNLVEARDYRGIWYKSKIIGIENGKYKVHFFGWDDVWNETVVPEKVRASNGFGSEVEVEQKGIWYKAYLVDSRYGSEHLAAYVGYNEEEWVKNDRIREPGEQGYGRAGKTVEVANGKNGDKWRRAIILKQRAGEVYVYYEGSEDVRNEWVSLDKVREIR